MVGGAVPRGRPQVTQEGDVGRTGERGKTCAGKKEKEWTNCLTDDRRMFGIMGNWSTTEALDPRAWYSIVCKGGCRFMATWVMEEEKASENWQGKRKAEEADKIEVALGVAVASLRRFRAALIGPIQGLPKRRRLCR